MADKFWLSAFVRLKSESGQTYEFCEIAAVVDAEFFVNLKLLYGEALLQCRKALDVNNLNIVSIKLTAENGKVKVVANVLLLIEADKQKTKLISETGELNDQPEVGKNNYRQVDIVVGGGMTKALVIYRLFKYMEVLSIKEIGDKFHELVHVRMITGADDDISASKF